MDGMSPGVLALVALGSVVFLVLFYFVLIKYIITSQRRQDRERSEGRDGEDGR